MGEGMRRFSALILLLTLVSASIACTAMTWTPVASASHPCCPHPKLPDSDRCATIACIGTSPVLVPNAASATAPILTVTITHERPVAEDVAPQWIAAHVVSPPESGLFLVHHQLLI
jgi:hypothetical protein